MDRRAKVELFEQIRREYEHGGGTIRGIAKKLGIHRRMVREAVLRAVPVERKTPVRERPKLEPAMAFIDAILEADRKAHRQPWDQLISFVRLVHREAANAQESFVKYGPEASDNSTAKEQERIAGEILAHLEDGGKLGSFVLFTHKSWGQFLEQTKVNNARPRLPEHFHALRQLFRLKGLREDLGARWDRQVAILGTARSSEWASTLRRP